MQIGDLEWTADASRRVVPGEIDIDRIGGTDQLVALTIASLQRGEVEQAAAFLAGTTDEEAQVNGSVIAATALVCAAAGDTEGTAAAVASLADCPSVTYLDRTLARLAAGLAAGGSHGRAVLAEALDELGGTGDRVGALVIGIADAALAEAVEADDRVGVRMEVDALMSELGIDAAGWRAYIGLAMGTADAAIPAT